MIIFLDIDGVLNSISWYKRREKKKHKTRLEYLLHEFDPAAISLLNELCNDVRAKIVVSSTWRIDGLDACRNYLKLAGATFDVIDITPQLSSRFRGEEIAAWLSDNCPKDFFNYAIIDDDSDMLASQYPNLFQTEFETGLTKEVCDKIKMFVNSGSVAA